MYRRHGINSVGLIQLPWVLTLLSIKKLRVTCQPLLKRFSSIDKTLNLHEYTPRSEMLLFDCANVFKRVFKRELVFLRWGLVRSAQTHFVSV